MNNCVMYAISDNKNWEVFISGKEVTMKPTNKKLRFEYSRIDMPKPSKYLRRERKLNG